MKLILQKQPRKYLASIDENTRKKLHKALDGLTTLTGDIKKLAGYKNRYRLKIAHYRILFSVEREIEIISVDEINTRTNIKY